MRRAVLAILAYLGTLIVVAPITILAVLFLAGPHAGLLPQALEVAVLLLGWAVVLGVPVYVAIRVWRRGT